MEMLNVLSHIRYHKIERYSSGKWTSPPQRSVTNPENVLNFVVTQALCCVYVYSGSSALFLCEFRMEGIFSIFDMVYCLHMYVELVALELKSRPEL